MGPRYVYEQKLLMRDILSRPSTSVRTAVLNDDEDAIVGYAVLGGVSEGHEALIPAVFYAFVKPDFRKMGVANSLLGDLEHRQVTYTHKPAYPLRSDLPKPENWTFSYYRNWNDV
jgi:GNAT superfamily N-acetyltransferase